MALKNVTLFEENTHLPHLVKHYAVETPHAIALIYEQQTLSYFELDQQATALAKYLQQQGVRKGDFVAIHLARSLELLIAIVALSLIHI